MIEQATNRDSLEAGLQLHLDERQKQIGRLEQVFAKLGKQHHKP